MWICPGSVGFEGVVLFFLRHGREYVSVGSGVVGAGVGCRSGIGNGHGDGVKDTDEVSVMTKVGIFVSLDG